VIVHSVQESTVINEGLVIMGVGMMVVFAFLTIMVISMGFMSNLILKFFPEKDEPIPVRRTKAAPAAAAPAPMVPAAVQAAPVADDSELAIAVAAVHSLITDNTETAIAIAAVHSLTNDNSELAVAIAAAHSLSRR
jgi:oxaloacetate decarboxylase gamma subunit